MREDSGTVVEAFLALIRTPDLPGLGAQVRGSRRAAAAVEKSVIEFCRGRGLTGETKDCLRAGALLWHDHLGASHTISQGIHSSDGSFLHGIMHRREPDYGNAAYWFRRVGEHAAFPRIADAVARDLESRGHPELAGQLVPGGRWDPFAMIKACEVALRLGDPSRVEVLQEVQRLEFEGLGGELLGL